MNKEEKRSKERLRRQQRAGFIYERFQPMRRVLLLQTLQYNVSG
jgi:hypothetical protein